jgi:hypothetical protein
MTFYNNTDLMGVAFRDKKLDQSQNIYPFVFLTNQGDMIEALGGSLTPTQIEVD